MYVALFNDEDFSWYSNEIESVLPRDAVLARYMLLSFVCPSIRYKPIWYRDDYTDRAGFRRGRFL